MKNLRLPIKIRRKTEMSMMIKEIFNSNKKVYVENSKLIKNMLNKLMIWRIKKSS